MSKKPINFLASLNLSKYEKKIYNAHLKNFLKNKPKKFIDFYKKVKSYSMLSKERLYNIYDCLNFINLNKINGDVVEIGCFKGGNIALCRQFSQKKIYGFDTFEGHPIPEKMEKDIWGNLQTNLFKKNKNWAKADVDQVKKNIKKLSYFKNIELIKGKVEYNQKNLKKIKKVSLLIIDVDWYKPTIFTLKRLFNKITKYGFLIVDDYGHHSGSRKAVDQFFKNKKKVKFYNIDYSHIVLQKL